MQSSSMKFRIGGLVLLTALFLAREVYLRSDVELFLEELDGNSTVVQISRREAKRLDYFFRELIINNSFAYTLAGIKPVSMTSFRKSFSSISNYRLLLGCRAWEKFKHGFNNNKIQYWTEDNSWVEGSTLLVLADREQFTQVINQNKQDFEQILLSLCADNLLERRPFFAKGLQKHDALIGMVLGYGRENSWLYYERFKNYFQWTLKQKLDSSKNLAPIWGRGMIEQQVRNLYFKSWTFRSWNIEDMLLPSFVGDPDSAESRQLKQEYLATREKLIHYYKSKNFLEATLSLYKNGPAILHKVNDQATAQKAI